MTPRRKVILAAVLAGVALSLLWPSSAPPPRNLAPLPKPPGWQWRGPNRDGCSAETGLLREWPEDGPPLLWSVDGCGKGFANVAIVDNTIYTAGTFDGQTFVLAFDMTGQPLWKAPNGEIWKTRPKEAAWVGSRYDGARTAPVISGNLVYHLNALGRLTAFDALTGAPLWALSLTETFTADVPLWGFSEHVLIVGEQLICYPGGTRGYMVALDRHTGKVVWANTDIGDAAGNGSPILVERDGVRQVITMTRVSVIGVDADTGRSLWRLPRDNGRDIKVETPLYHDGAVYVSDGYKFGGELLRLTRADGGIEAHVVWSNPRADSLTSGPILHEGNIYGVGYNSRQWFCLDATTGEMRHTDRSIQMGSLTFADGMLYCLEARGTMYLIQPSSDALKVVNSFRVPRTEQGFLFAHPVVYGKRLYLRAGDTLLAYDVAKRP